MESDRNRYRGESIWGEEFKNEVCDELLPLRGALCMANSGADTNGSQFFIVQAKADTARRSGRRNDGFYQETKQLFLDQGGYPSLTGSYTVFGQMIEGYDVLDKIAAFETQDSVSGEQSQPVKKVVIEKMTVSNAE
ncbi:MAG: peptidylprolyl isomerase [Anaerostipes hadrus]